jgi:hypothetical protein
MGIAFDVVSLLTLTLASYGQGVLSPSLSNALLLHILI